MNSKPEVGRTEQTGYDKEEKTHPAVFKVLLRRKKDAGRGEPDIFADKIQIFLTISLRPAYISYCFGRIYKKNKKGTQRNFLLCYDSNVKYQEAERMLRFFAFIGRV